MPKRGQGEGSIYQRSDGRWTAVISLDNGKRKSFYSKTRKEVQDKLVIALRDQQQGLPMAPEKQTLSQFLGVWLTDSVKPTVRPRTIESYSQLVRVHIVPDAIGRRVLARLSPQDLQAFLNGMLAKGLSPRTVQYLHAIIRSALNQALRWGFVARNVATLVDSPRVRRPEIKPLTPEQARCFLEVAKDDRLAALYAVAIALGLRQGEALGLRWQDVDLDGAMLRVSLALQRVNGKLQLVEPKTDRSRRSVPLPPVAVVALRQHRVHQLEERLLAGERWQNNGLVFTTTIGTPLDGHNVTRQFKMLMDKAGLPPIRFHDLRHTCASLLLAQGLSPRLIMETLGHSQISLTMNTYSHVMPALQREAADKMQELLG
jgi:integrase